tara:strand:- start:241 stop:633 length:393 start_codon:yes stop_codon:yes gene_type:complete
MTTSVLELLLEKAVSLELLKTKKQKESATVKSLTKLLKKYYSENDPELTELDQSVLKIINNNETVGSGPEPKEKTLFEVAIEEKAIPVGSKKENYSDSFLDSIIKQNRKVVADAEKEKKDNEYSNKESKK